MGAVQPPAWIRAKTGRQAALGSAGLRLTIGLVSCLANPPFSRTTIVGAFWASQPRPVASNEPFEPVPQRASVAPPPRATAADGRGSKIAPNPAQSPGQSSLGVTPHPRLSFCRLTNQSAIYSSRAK